MEAILPHWQILVVQIITFVVGMAAIWKLYISSLRDHLKLRREGIAKDLSSAENARQEAEHLRAQVQADRLKMADELRQAREEAKAEVARLRDELLTKARVEQDSLLKQGRTQIQAEREEALRQIRQMAASLVVQATGKLLEKNLNSTAQKSLAEKFVKQIKISKN